MDDRAFDALVTKATRKREALIRRALKGRSWRRTLLFLAGALALLSGAAVVVEIGVHLKLVNEFRLLSASLALMSGVISLIIATYFEEREIHKLFEGAAKFLALREQAHSRTVSLPKLESEFIRLSDEYDPLLPPSYATTAAGIGPVNVSGGTGG